MDAWTEALLVRDYVQNSSRINPFFSEYYHTDWASFGLEFMTHLFSLPIFWCLEKTLKGKRRLRSWLCRYTFAWLRCLRVILRLWRWIVWFFPALGVVVSLRVGSHIKQWWLAKSMSSCFGKKIKQMKIRMDFPLNVAFSQPHEYGIPIKGTLAI